MTSSTILTHRQDKIDLIGFDNIAGFADIQGNIAEDANGNAVITLGDGETIRL